jgi:mRNA-capping enzyme
MSVCLQEGKGRDIGKCDFGKRMACIRNEVIEPRTRAMADGRIDRTNETLGVRIKDFWPVSVPNVEKLLGAEFARVVSHEIDGLIFQPVPDVSWVW